jgi:acyl-CoA thioesterase I
LHDTWHGLFSRSSRAHWVGAKPNALLRGSSSWVQKKAPLKAILAILDILTFGNSFLSPLLFSLVLFSLLSWGAHAQTPTPSNKPSLGANSQPSTPSPSPISNNNITKNKILILGDSLSAEYGLIKGQGWVALLEQKLNAEQLPWSVINASISGETTSGGLARLRALLATHQPQLVVIELGANDALRGLELKATQFNLLQMAKMSKEAKAKVLLIGIQMPPNYGRQYNEDLKATFAEVAQKSQVAFIPLFFQGLLNHLQETHQSTLATDEWFQADRIHPLAKAHPFLFQGIWPTLKKSLKD